MGLFAPDVIAAMTGGVRPAPPKDYALPTQFPSLKGVKRICLDLESYDVDIEAKGPGWRRDAYPVGFGLAIEARDGSIPFSEYYPLKHREAPNLDADKVYQWLRDELIFFTGEIVGANLLYDADGLQYQNIMAPCAMWRDVQWAEALLDENALTYRLYRLCQKYLGENKVTEVLKQLYGPGYIERFRDVHPGHARAYGVGDVEKPLRVYAEQRKQLKKENLLELFDLETRLMPFLLYMRRGGVRVDLKAAESLGRNMIGQRDAALREATKLVGLRGFEFNSENFGKPTTRALAFKHLGIPFAVGKNGLPTGITDKWLEALDHPIGEHLAIANQCDKAVGTFVDGYISDYQINGRVFPEFNPLKKTKDDGDGHIKKNGTVTGRFSATNPNLQNIPTRDEEIGPLARGMFIADEGCEWWSQDYSQIEYRFLIHYAVALGCKGADVPQRMYRDNPATDFHDFCAALMFEKEWKEAESSYKSGRITKDELKAVQKRLRKPAKNLNFGMAYGMGVMLLAEQLGEIEIGEDGKPRPTKRAIQIMDRYHEVAPFIRELNKKCTAEAQELGYMTTILNRRRRFDRWEPKYTEKGAPRPQAYDYEKAVQEYGDKLKRAECHKGPNARLQGSAADLMKLAMVNIWEAGVLNPGNDITCCLTVHDELNGSFVRSARGLESLGEIKRIMETSMSLHVPVLTGGSTGRTWAEAK
jgi:DNA polymerase I-like protein with 3'-5' exonuclease and polymerase domains